MTTLQLQRVAHGRVTRMPQARLGRTRLRMMTRVTCAIMTGLIANQETCHQLHLTDDNLDMPCHAVRRISDALIEHAR